MPLGLTAPSGTLAQVLQNLTRDTPAPVNLAGRPLLPPDASIKRVAAFGLIIRALATNDDVNLLSTPSITTMDNEEAKIIVGQSVPFRSGSTLTGSDGATNPFTTINRQDVGLTLEVTPHIHDGNLVRLKVHQEVSEVDMRSLGTIGSTGNADLITNKRTIDTTVLVDNQEVIILGGLIRDRETIDDSRVPVLGSIPGLGFLFRSNSTTIEKQNLLIFLRPTILDNRDAIANATTKKFDGIYEVEIEGRDPARVISDLFDGKSP